jgi:hypothetical protein
MASSGRLMVIATVAAVALGCLATEASGAPPRVTTPSRVRTKVLAARPADGLTRRGWLRRANALCNDAQQQVYALKSSVLHGEVFPASFPSQSFADYLTRTAKIGRRVLHDLRALKAPPHDRELIDAGIRAMAQTVDLTANLAQLARGDGTGYRDAVRGRAPTEEEEEMNADRFRFQNYGAGSCAYLGLGPSAGD